MSLYMIFYLFNDAKNIELNTLLHEYLKFLVLLRGGV
jgi:hypothetical protein